jgi:hypothetical protein
MGQYYNRCNGITIKRGLLYAYISSMAYYVNVGLFPYNAAVIISIQNHISNDLVAWLALLLRIQDVRDLNVGLKTGYPEDFHAFRG